MNRGAESAAAVMWSIFFLFLSYLDGDLAKGEDSALDDGESIGEAALRRSKRGFTYPGTLWCGAGNIAENFDQLGEFAETDKCCRTHDHCPHVIYSFSTKYGFTNFKWHSISHCDCDNTLKQCLRAVNDTSSRVVGQAFFNVIEVPCFEFSLEEQCVERHWYGVCKRYDKVPVAVVQESIPYDFGGIDVIDALTLAPPKEKLAELDKDEQEEKKGSESTRQSSFSPPQSPAPEEPSLTNVVTAAEDFIKVLATVSTSQSSSADGDKGEAQSSDKKRKKNGGKKKKGLKKRRGKGKGKKRRQNAGRVPKANESVAGAPSVNATEGAISKNNFVENPANFDWASKNGNFLNDDLNSVRDGVHPNKMMRDDHQRRPEEGQLSTTSGPNAERKPERLHPRKEIKDRVSVQLSFTSTSKPRNARLRQSMGRKGQRYATLISLHQKGTVHNTMADNTQMSPTETSSLAGLTTHTPINPSGEVTLHNLESGNEKGSAFTAPIQNAPIVGTKRVRSRQRGGRKTSGKRRPPSLPAETFTAEEASGLTNDTTWKHMDVAERLQPNAPETVTERPIMSTAGDIRAKKRQQRLKDTGDRRRNRQPNSDSSIMKGKLKPSREAGTISDYSTSTIPAATDADARVKDVDLSAEGLSPSRQNIPLSGDTRKSQSRKSKVRDEKKRRIKQNSNLD